MEGNPYSPLKVFHHRERIDQLREGDQPAPAQVQLIISDLCNQSCHFCAYRMEGYSSNQLFTVDAELASFGSNNPKRQLEYAKIVEILDDCEEMGVGAIQLTGGGEPTVHPNHLQVFKDVLSRDMELALVTNGILMGEAAQEILVNAAWVRVSIDAGTPASYASIRSVNPKMWAKAWSNIASLASKRNQARTDMILGVGYVMTKDNWRDVLLGVGLAKKAGADNIRISAVFQPDDEHYFAEFYETAADLCKQAVRMYQDKSFKVFNNFGDRVADLVQHSPDYEFCGYQHFTTYIGGDLNVYRCCVLAYNERGIIGNLKFQTFAELWASQSKEDDFDNFDARGCDRCPFNEKNRTILYAIESSPMHANFV